MDYLPEFGFVPVQTTFEDRTARKQDGHATLDRIGGLHARERKARNQSYGLFSSNGVWASPASVSEGVENLVWDSAQFFEEEGGKRYPKADETCALMGFYFLDRINDDILARHLPEVDEPGGVADQLQLRHVSIDAPEPVHEPSEDEPWGCQPSLTATTVMPSTSRFDGVSCEESFEETLPPVAPEPAPEAPPPPLPAPRVREPVSKHPLNTKLSRRPKRRVPARPLRTAAEALVQPPPVSKPALPRIPCGRDRSSKLTSGKFRQCLEYEPVEIGKERVAVRVFADAHGGNDQGVMLVTITGLGSASYLDGRREDRPAPRDRLAETKQDKQDKVFGASNDACPFCHEAYAEPATTVLLRCGHRFCTRHLHEVQGKEMCGACAKRSCDCAWRVICPLCGDVYPYTTGPLEAPDQAARPLSMHSTEAGTYMGGLKRDFQAALFVDPPRKSTPRTPRERKAPE